MLSSSDAGVTWLRSESLLDPPGFAFLPSVTRLDLGLVADFGATLFVSVIGEASGHYTGYVYRSTDRGLTWSYFRALPPAVGPLVFLTPNRWLEIGLEATGSQQTTDSGATWHTTSTDYNQAAGVSPQIAFGDASTGYVSLRGFVKRTADAGAHWMVISTPGTTP